MTQPWLSRDEGGEHRWHHSRWQQMTPHGIISAHDAYYAWSLKRWGWWKRLSRWDHRVLHSLWYYISAWCVLCLESQEMTVVNTSQQMSVPLFVIIYQCRVLTPWVSSDDSGEHITADETTECSTLCGIISAPGCVLCLESQEMRVMKKAQHAQDAYYALSLTWRRWRTQHSRWDHRVFHSLWYYMLLLFHGV